MNQQPHQDMPVIFAGEELSDAKASMILIHGRGAAAESIITLKDEFNIPGFAYAAPQANNYSWYPYSFLFPVEENEPGISSGLKVINDLIDKISSSILKEKIILLGFSQGACLTLEYAARNPQKFGGVIGLSGGLIGDKINSRLYSGSMEGTAVFLGCSDTDPHIPLDRVNKTKEVFKNLNAEVEERIYPSSGHSVNQDEINFVKDLMNSLLQ